MHEPVSSKDADSSPRDGSSSCELGIWLIALRSFFNLNNHPFSDAERAELISRDFSNELGIVRQVLRHGLLLSLNYAPDQDASRGDSYDADAYLTATLSLARDPSTQASDASAASLSNTLSDLCELSEVLLSSKVDFQVWTNFERVVTQTLEQSQAVRHLERRSRAGSLSRQQPELHKLTEQIPHDALAADMLAIFSQLARLLEQLRAVETLLRRDHPLKQTLPVFTLVHEETRALIEFIEKRAIRTEEIDGAVFDALDSTGYALGVELVKVFGRELVGLASLRQPPAIYTKVENAHGLLRDSFQQTTVALAQLFDPTFDGARLFQFFHTKLEQSLALRRDLWTLLQLVLQAEKDRDRRPLAPLLGRLDGFRDGSLRFLMYKDWESYERFVAEVAAARGAVELSPVLHRFGTYLEALFGQINMRAVLADQPFDYPAIVE